MQVLGAEIGSLIMLFHSLDMTANGKGLGKGGLLLESCMF